MSAARDELVTFFRSCELGKAPAWVEPPKDWMAGLVEAHAKELSFDLAGAKAALERVKDEVPAGPFRNVAELLALRVAVREAKADGIADALARVAKLLESLDDDETPTRARALHLRSVADVRLGRLESAEDGLTSALELVDDSPARLWITDTLAQVLIGQGAWTEAIRTLEALVEKRRASGDAIGVAISAGHLVRLNIQLGKHEEAVTLAQSVLDGLGPNAALLTRLRVYTMLTGALIEIGDPARLAPATDELSSLVRSAERDSHYLRGYAVMTLARASALLDRSDDVRKWLDEAGREFSLAGHLAQLRYHEARIDPSVTKSKEWIASVEALWGSMDLVGEAEIQTRLLLAREAFRIGEDGVGRARLDAAYARAINSNNPLWMHWVDEAASELDPPQLSERLATRFSGRKKNELGETKREEVTIIFADLVNFTPRTLELTPEEVMRTVRGLFELGVPLLTKHLVSPLTYMGDGLLAIAQGDGHAKRGLEFARELVGRAGRMTKVRRLLDSGWPIDLRAGVATGTVVLGSLGTLFKMDFAAIGVTTNLAARLQGQAQPGEVMAARTTIEQAKLDLPFEQINLKGFEKWSPIEAARIGVYKAE